MNELLVIRIGQKLMEECYIIDDESGMKFGMAS